MTEFFDKNISLHCGDCLQILPTLPETSVDAVICDPPYEIGFMGKKWDGTGIAYNVDVWKECFRVLKPGGHLLAFGGARTYHRLACAIDDAGFDIRDQIMWLFGSGMPKSLDIGKAIDKAAGAEREVIGKRIYYDGRIKKPRSSSHFGQKPVTDDTAITAPATPDAAKWEGWYTGLKPAHEPICVARKPISEKNIALNVLKWGCGGINIEECRVGSEGKPVFINGVERERERSSYDTGGSNRTGEISTQGRFPANLVHDGSPEAVSIFPKNTKSGGGRKGEGGVRCYLKVGESNSLSGKRSYDRSKEETFWDSERQDHYVISPLSYDTGSAARYFKKCEFEDSDFDIAFYCAKASKKDRNSGGVKNVHPTVKPVKLMRYLCKLVTPVNGVILDPFMGSGLSALKKTRTTLNLQKQG